MQPLVVASERTRLCNFGGANKKNGLFKRKSEEVCAQFGTN